MALPAQIECCERERRLTDSIAGVLDQGETCQAIYSLILTASALRWKKTRLAAAPYTVIIIVGGETRAFILRMAINECKDILKSGWRRRSVPLDELIEREIPFLPAEDSGVLTAVQRLPVKYREVIYLYYYEGYNAEEIAAMVGAKPAAIRQRLARARAKLKQELEGSEYETV